MPPRPQQIIKKLGVEKMDGRIGRIDWDDCNDCEHLQSDSSCQHFIEEQLKIEHGIVFCLNFKKVETVKGYQSVPDDFSDDFSFGDMNNATNG